MKKVLVFLFLVVSLFSYADPDEIVLNPSGSGGNRSDYPPQVFYDNFTRMIIINGGGIVNYYDVVISSAATNTVEISTQVNGTYDTFDVSSLPAGSHIVTITSQFHNTYEGQLK